LLSTAIISHYLNESGISNEWLDVRDLLRTDNTFRDAAVDWDYTSERVKHTVSRPGIYLTQGFIGCTADNESTTLGREGSDFTAAIFANILNAESLTIWKDVEAVMSADPKRFPDAQPLQELNFTEVIEMAYYGAQVIHPKTIKPLQNKGIPLHVKCFLNPELPGTLIHKKNSKGLPPIIVVKENQALLHLNSQDFSFVGEEPMSWLYALLHKIKTRPNLIQTGAINVQLCMDYRAEKIEQLAAAAAALFDVQVEKDLTLLTIRHYNTETFEQLTRGKEIVLTQRTVDTVQVLIRQ
ncbi:MAG: aspartate kinase, partial [Chitinophagaceae bacterium]|nr:aspartate kinase [Chitinophagaceae bacterium]